jgi:hypothetical protein
MWAFNQKWHTNGRTLAPNMSTSAVANYTEVLKIDPNTSLFKLEVQQSVTTAIIFQVTLCYRP